MKWIRGKIYWLLSALGIITVAFAMSVSEPTNLGGPANSILTIQERVTIEKFEDDYFKEHGEYIQVRADRTLASDSKQTMREYKQNNNLNINKDFKIHVFTDNGVWGYKIIEIPPPAPPFQTSTSTII